MQRSRHPERRPLARSARHRTSDHDVVVVGARPAGAATAMLLARAGLDVLVLDRDPYGSDALSTHALMRGGVVQLQRFGLLERLAAGGTPAVTTVAFTYGQDREVVDLSESAGALHAPRRTVLDPLLVGAARSAGADVRHEVSVTDVLRDRTGRVVGVRARDRSGGSLVATARVVVGADGLRSRLARAVEAPMTWRGTGSGAVAYAHVDDLPASGYEWIYGEQVAAGLIPTDGGKTVLWAGTASRELRTGRAGGLPEWFRRTLEAAAPDLAGPLADRRLPRLRGFLGTPGYLRRPHGPGWALVGDAGCFADPISAHGITQALGDAELLADALLAVLRDGAGEHDALAGYEQVRDAMARPLLEAVDAVARYDWTLDQVRERLLGLSAAMKEETAALLARDPGGDARHRDAGDPGGDARHRDAPDPQAGRARAPAPAAAHA